MYSYMVCNYIYKTISGRLRHVTPPIFLVVVLAATLEVLHYCFASKVISVTSFTITAPFVPSTKYLVPSSHITWAFFSSSDLAMHSFVTSSSQLVKSVPLLLLHPYSFSQPLSTDVVHKFKQHQNLLFHSITHLFSHTSSAPHLFNPPSTHPVRSAHT